MKISLIPWEIIWLTILLLFFISLFGTLIRMFSRRRFNLRHWALPFGLLLGLALIPAGLWLTDYRFSLAGDMSEVTSPDHELPDLRIRSFPGYTNDEVYQASLRVVQASRSYLQPWRITFVGQDDQAGRIVAQVPSLWFTDDLSITVQPSQDLDAVIVVLFSQSSGANRDFGENARHIKCFYDALEAELAK